MRVLWHFERSEESLVVRLSRGSEKNSEVFARSAWPIQFSSVVRSGSRHQFQTSMNPHPKLSVETATQLAVFLANRPGALARVCEELAKAGINIYALATSDTVDHTVVRMVVNDPTKALMLLGEAGVLALETDVLTIETANEPGVLAKIAERLAEAHVNIEYTYLAASRAADKGLIILRPSDVEKANRALEDLQPPR
jgi:hypothetical protein